MSGLLGAIALLGAAGCVVALVAGRLRGPAACRCQAQVDQVACHRSGVVRLAGAWFCREHAPRFAGLTTGRTGTLLVGEVEDYLREASRRASLRARARAATDRPAPPAQVT